VTLNHAAQLFGRQSPQVRALYEAWTSVGVALR